MPRTFLEWHVYGIMLGKSTLILWGLLRRQGEAQAGFWVIVDVCVSTCVLAFAFMCFRLFCLPVCGLRRGGAYSVSVVVLAASSPNYFYMFVFWLKCPLKAMK